MAAYKFIDEEKRGKKQHIHTLDGEPLMGVSTILKVLNKPLTWWASGLAVGHMGWTHSKKFTPATRLAIAKQRLAEISKLTPEEYLGCLDEAYKAHSVFVDEAAESGIDMHAELEKFVKECINLHEGLPIPFYESKHLAVQLFSTWARDNVYVFLASEAYCYSEKLRIGGIVDLIYEDLDGNLCLLDFKSAKEAYLDHFLQNAGYDLLISENGTFNREGEQFMTVHKPFNRYGVFPYGMENPEPQFRSDTEALKKGFLSCIPLYELTKQTQKSWQR